MQKSASIITPSPPFRAWAAARWLGALWLSGMGCAAESMDSLESLESIPSIQSTAMSPDTTHAKRLPAGVAAQALSVVNQLDGDAGEPIVIRGEPGAPGQVGRDGSCEGTCPATLPGVTSTTVITARGVNPPLASYLSSISAKSGSDNELATNTGAPLEPPGGTLANGLLAAFIDRTASAFGAHAVSTEGGVTSGFFTDYDALKTQLDHLTDTTLVVLVSHGDVVTPSSMPGDRSAVTAVLETMGAPQALRTLTASEAFVFLGYRGMGQGNGTLVRTDVMRDVDGDSTADARVAEASALLVHGDLIATRSRQQQRLAGASIMGTLTIDDGTGDGETVTLSETDGALVVSANTVIQGMLTAGDLGDTGGAGPGLLYATNGVVGDVTLGAASRLSLSGGTLSVQTAPTFAGLTVGDVPITHSAANTLTVGGAVHAASLMIPGGTTLPATCTDGQFYLDTDGFVDTGGFYACAHAANANATARWSLVSGPKSIRVASENYRIAGTNAGWSTTCTNCMGGASADPIPVTACGPTSVLGGLSFGGTAVGAPHCMTKTFSNLPPHRFLRFTGTLFFLDSWDTEDGYILVGSQQIFRKTSQHAEVARLRDVCGMNAYKDLEATVDETVVHSASSVVVSVCHTLDNPPDDESLGLADMTLMAIP